MTNDKKFTSPWLCVKSDLKRKIPTVHASPLLASRIYYLRDIGTPTGSFDHIKNMINSALSCCMSGLSGLTRNVFNSKHQRIDLSVSVKNSLTLPRNSLRNIISGNWSRMYGFSFRLFSDYISYCRLANSSMTFCIRDSKRRANMRQPRHLVYATINGATSNFS